MSHEIKKIITLTISTSQAHRFNYSTVSNKMILYANLFILRRKIFVLKWMSKKNNILHRNWWNTWEDGGNTIYMYSNLLPAIYSMVNKLYPQSIQVQFLSFPASILLKNNVRVKSLPSDHLGHSTHLCTDGI